MKVASLKQSLKQILVNKQHRLYEKEAASKNLTYDSWIKKQEEKAKDDQHIENIDIKILTSDSEIPKNEREKNKNDGKNADEYGECQWIEVFDKGNPVQSKKTIISIYASALYPTDSRFLQLVFPLFF